MKDTWIPKHTQNARLRLDALLSGEKEPQKISVEDVTVIQESQETPKRIKTIELQKDGSHSILSDFLSLFSKKPT